MCDLLPFLSCINTETSGSRQNSLPTLDPTHAGILTTERIQISDLLVLLNYISHYWCQYLDATTVAEIWQSHCPSTDWFNQFKINQEAMITFSGSCSFSVSIFDLYLSDKWIIKVLSSCQSHCQLTGQD
jgi:hypothetical protein